MKTSKFFVTWIVGLTLLSTPLLAQAREANDSSTPLPATQGPSIQRGNEEINNLNQALAKQAASRSTNENSGADYVIGPNDLIEISVFDVADLSRVVRVSNQGRISMPLIGAMQASGLTAHELEVVIAELLRQKYVKNPQVSVFIKEFQSRPVAIYGAVKKPGVMQLQTPRTLIEVLAMAEGFSEDAGDYVTVRRHASAVSGVDATPQATETGSVGNGTSAIPPDAEASTDAVQILKIKITDLISSNDPKYNLMIKPGDAVNVAKAGIVYVTGDVGRPGGFVLKERESLTVLQAISLAEGTHYSAAKKSARIIRKYPDGKKEEIPVDLAKVFEGKAPDLPLQNNDVLFIPTSASKGALRRTAEAVLQTATGMAIYRR